MAKLFLDAGDTFTLSNDATVIGSTGTETVKISGTPNVQLDANIERIELSGATTDYTYQVSGTTITVYSAGVAVATLNGLNQDATVAFTDGSATLALTGIGAATLGGTALPTTAAAVVPATVNATDVSSTGGTTAPTTGVSVALTKSSSSPDAPTLTAGSDTIDGTTVVGSLEATDRIIDSSTSDSDVLNSTISSYSAAVTPTIINVETINIAGQYNTTGAVLTNVTGAKDVVLTAGITGGTATVVDLASTKAAALTASTNVGSLTVGTLAAGTGGATTVNAGSATTVALNGGAGADVLTLNAASANSTLTLDSGATSTADALTLNLAGATYTTTFTTANGWDTLNINSNSAANTVTLASANAIAAVATGNKVTVGGTQALTITGDMDAVAGSSRTNGVVIEKASGAGTVTLSNNAAVTATHLNRAVVDVVDLTTAIAQTALTVNEATTIKLSFDQTSGGAVTYDVDNNGSTQITAATGTLNLNLAASQSVNALTLGVGVGTANIDVTASSGATVASYDTATTATAVDTTVITGSKNLTVSAWSHTAEDVFAASAFTGALTLTSTDTDSKVVLGGSGNDTITLSGIITTDNTVVRGGAGNDSITVSAATGKVSIFGDAGDDSIVAGAGTDVVDGGAGNDYIDGNELADTLTGGAGTDIFNISTAAAQTDSTDSAYDTITDFSGDILRFLAAENVAGSATGAAVAATTVQISSGGKVTFHANDDTLAEKIAAVAADDANIATNEVVFFEHGSDTYVYGAGAGTTVAANDFLVKLAGVTNLTTLSESVVTAGDFSLV